MMEKNLMVSIVCTSYNHEHYIAEAIESFLMQKTDFAFEILIHDDASTDRTAEIIRIYEKKYPELIKPIYQTENQYSRGVSVEKINESRAKGKYIAVCEGDDYWTSPHKLQKQFDYMEAHPECSMCVHTAARFSDVKKKVVSYVRPSKRDRLFSVEEVIEGGGDLFATNSSFYPREKMENSPDFCTNGSFGDYPVAIYLALQGNVFFMDDCMAVYRVDVSGSWTQRSVSDIKKKIKNFKEISNMLDEINEYTNHRYESVILRTKKRDQFYLLLKQKKLREALAREYKEIYFHTDFLRRIVKKVIL